MTNDEAPMSEAELARMMFDAYNAEAGGLTWDGKPIPPFDAVGPKVQANWFAAARCAMNALNAMDLGAVSP